MRAQGGPRPGAALGARTVQPCRAALLTAAVLLGAAVLVAGCSAGAPGSAASGPPPGTSLPSVVGSPSPGLPAPSASRPTPGGAAPGQTGAPDVRAGETPAVRTSAIGGAAVRYPSGLRVQVRSVGTFTPSDLAVGTDRGDVGVVVDVAVTNGSRQPLDPTLMTVALRAGSARALAPRVFDAPHGLGQGITGVVPAGEQSSGRYAFAVAPADLGRVEVVVDPDLRRPDQATFTGSLPPPAPTAPTSPGTSSPGPSAPSSAASPPAASPATV